MHMYYDGGSFMGGMHWFWWLLWLLPIGAMVVYAWGRWGEQRRPALESPRQLLQRRLASGEITPEQYEQRKTLLDRDSDGLAGKDGPQ